MNAGFILVAAGEGRLLGSTLPKALVDLGGRPLIAHSFAALQGAKEFTAAVVVAPRGHRAETLELVSPRCRPGLTLGVVDGGARRQDSVAAGLAALPAGLDLVVIHDAARPFVRVATVARCLAAAAEHGAATVARAATDTIKEVDGRGVVLRTLDRATLRTVQTPQAFRLEVLRQAHERARLNGWEATDDAALVELCGREVWTVPGDPDNLKITTAEDLEWARWRLAAAPR